MSGLLRAAALEGGRLRVVDFGGSLGSVYRQCRSMLEGLTSIRWTVIEQEAFVIAGRAEFTTDELRFERAIEDVPNDEQTVIMASSVLQYLEDPAAALDTFAQSAARHLIIDRTPMGAQSSDRLCVQYVPAHIYPGSYPCWILSRSRLMDGLLRAWNVVCDFPCAEGTARTDDGLEFEFRGVILERKK
jgi:putative methyltransferase (TIGR04325 family)